MPNTPLQPTSRKIPAGFVDAWGLDHESIHVVPRVVTAVKAKHAKAPASKAQRELAFATGK